MLRGVRLIRSGSSEVKTALPAVQASCWRPPPQSAPSMCREQSAIWNRAPLLIHVGGLRFGIWGHIRQVVWRIHSTSKMILVVTSTLLLSIINAVALIGWCALPEARSTCVIYSNKIYIFKGMRSFHVSDMWLLGWKKLNVCAQNKLTRCTCVKDQSAKTLIKRVLWKGGQMCLTEFSCVFQYQIAKSRISSFGGRTQALVSVS